MRDELMQERDEPPRGDRGERGNHLLLVATLVVLIAVIVVGFFLVRELTTPRAPATLAEQTIAELERQLDGDRGNALLYFKLADAYYSVQEYEDALGVLDDLRSQETTGYTLAHIMYGTGRIEAARGNTDVAVEEYLASLETWELPEVYFALAELYAGEGDTDSAIENLEQYVALMPADASGWVRLAERYIEAGDDTAALDAYKKAATMMPDDETLADKIAKLEAQ